MLETFFSQSKVIGRLRANSIGSSIDCLAEYFSKQGYAPDVAKPYLRAAIHFSYWLKTKHISLRNINEETLEKFLSSHFKKCSCPIKGGDLRLCRSALNHFLRVLRDKHLVTLPPKTVHLTPADRLLHKFGNYMEQVHGTTLSTVHVYTRYIREFLRVTYKDGTIKFNTLDANSVREYVSAKAKGYQPKTAQLLASSLRTFFRFLQVINKMKRPLEHAVPTIPYRRLSNIPKHLTEEQLESLLSSFDLSTPNGLRDQTMALLMSKIALRAGEVANLRLDDLNWREGIIKIKKSKSRRASSLPLSKEVGEALAAYLKKGRPYSKERYIFVTHTLPAEKPLTAAGAARAIGRAFKRCALPVPFHGSHALRHTLATLLLQKNATLKEVSDILRHRSIATTNIYTKVNFSQLSQVILPWPEVI